MNIKKFENYEKDVETTQAKIRNKLSPYWNLIAMIESLESISEEKKKKVWKYIKQTIDNIKSEKESLLELIRQTEK